MKSSSGSRPVNLRRSTGGENSWGKDTNWSPWKMQYFVTAVDKCFTASKIFRTTTVTLCDDLKKQNGMHSSLILDINRDKRERLQS